jgi:hypothetical protein
MQVFCSSPENGTRSKLGTGSASSAVAMFPQKYPSADGSIVSGCKKEKPIDKENHYQL